MYLGYLLNGKRSLEKAHPVSAELFIDAETEEPQFRHLVVYIFSPVMILLILIHMGSYLAFGEILRHILEASIARLLMQNP